MEKTSQTRPGNGRWKLLAILGVCAAPLIFSYITYYWIKPAGRTNYGDILDPRNYPLPKLNGHLLGGEAKELDAYKGKWIMLQVDTGACNELCKKKLYDMRQLRLAQGKEMDRIERVWLITDDTPVETLLLREYDGTRMIRVDTAALQKWLPTEAGTDPSDHIYMLDPLSNLMMRFPKAADPNKIKKDLAKLLRASGIG
ncbi:MAG: cytochrome C oxidase subunit I [Burkholderiaceae bacterium]|nr:cytochrome C oxidase subunit I [Burkholderiaceae bacterium]